MSIPWSSLIARWCPSLDTSGRSSSTLNQVTSYGLLASPNNAATLTDMVPALDWANDTGSLWSIDFKGGNDRAIATGYGDSWGTADRSYSFWLRVDDALLNEDWISNRILGAAGTQTGFLFGKSGTSTTYTRPLVVLVDAASGHYKNCVYSSFYTVGVFHHIVVVWQNSTGALTVYRDGSAVSVSFDLSAGTVAGKSIGSTGDLTLSGRPGTTSGRSLDGAIDDVCEWSVALTSTQAAAIYSASRGSRQVANSRRRRATMGAGIL